MSGPRRGPMRRLGDVLPEVATRLGVEGHLDRALAATSWERLVAELVPPAAGATRLVGIRPPTLLVSADDPMAGQELRLNADLLLRAFSDAPGGQAVRELRVLVRPPSP